MKKVLGLLVLYATLITNLHGVTYSNKTFLQTRSETLHMPRESALWHPHTSNDVGNSFGLTTQATFFYHDNDNTRNLGKYFGVAKGNELNFKFQPDETELITTFPSYSIKHTPTEGEDFTAQANIKARHQHYGIMLGLFQDLETVAHGLSVKLLLPIVYNRNEVKLVFCTDDEQVNCKIRDYFRGNITQTETDRVQAPLKCGIFGCDESTTLIGDIIATLQYNFLEGYDHFIGINGGVFIPGGNEPNGKFLFEPIVGAGGHFGLTLGADAAATLWRSEKSTFEFVWKLSWYHLFKRTQKRIIGLLGQDGSKMAWAHYRLGGEVGKKGVFPLANVLCRDVRVSVGNHVEAMASFALNVSRFNFTFGVDLYGREAESVQIKSFPENRYGIAIRSYLTTEDFSELSLENGERLITCDMLDTCAPATPAQASASIFAALGYADRNTNYPVLFGIGAAYEFAFNNSISEGFNIWGTVGISF